MADNAFEELSRRLAVLVAKLDSTYDELLEANRAQRETNQELREFNRQQVELNADVRTRFCQVVEAETLITQAGVYPRSSPPFRRPAPSL